MASEEERAKIIAEYMNESSTADAADGDDRKNATTIPEIKAAGFEDDYAVVRGSTAARSAAAPGARAAVMDDDDDEADFDPHAADDSEDGNFSGDDDDDDDDDEGATDPVVLNGAIHLNEEGRVIYSGTWCLQSELLLPVGKKLPKFKLKSQESCHSPYESAAGSSATAGNANGSGATANSADTTKSESRKGRKSHTALFDIQRPTLSKEPAPGPDDSGIMPPTRRTMIFDGFFLEPLPTATAADGGGGTASNGGKHHGKKVKERDVEVFFTTERGGPADGAGGPPAAAEYRVSGRGRNGLGSFLLDGTYRPPSPRPAAGGAAPPRRSARVRCTKSYGPGGGAKATRGGGAPPGAKRARSARSDDSDDDLRQDDYDGKPGFSEVNELCHDAGLSIEELRRKYYGGGDDDAAEDGGGKVEAKRARYESSDDDDECGF